MAASLVQVQEWLCKKYILYRVSNIGHEAVSVKLDNFHDKENPTGVCNLFYSRPEWFSIGCGETAVFKIYQKKEYHYQQEDQLAKFEKKVVLPCFSMFVCSATNPAILKKDFLLTQMHLDPRPFSIHFNVQVEK